MSNMNAVPIHETPTSGQMLVQESRREALSALLDGEVLEDDLDALLAPGSEDMAALLSDGQTYELIGDVLRERPLQGLVGGAAFAGAVMARLRDEPLALPQPEGQQAGAGRPVAANDAVFRWKLVAGLASLAAVVAVTWTIGTGGQDGNLSGPQMANANPVSESASTIQPVVVQTAQGQVLRDARLEQLLSEHRQFGGMSALQAPAGFLRNATYDAAPQR
jgi:sigma-E factor negative regulatory protein RseA